MIKAPMSAEERAHNELFEKVGHLMATAQATQDSVALLRSETAKNLDGISRAISEHMETADKAIASVSGRVAVLETDRRMVYGIGGVIAFVVTFFGSWIRDGIKHILHFS